MKFPVLEIFSSIQGEGIYSGIPSIFLRVGGCNLRCVFGDSRCDTPYSSFELEKPVWDNVDDAFDVLHEAFSTTGIKHLVITGGEPMLYKEGLKELVTRVKREIGNTIKVTVETNGTIPALRSWYYGGEFYSIDLWSISPKLSTSVDKDLKYLKEEERNHHDKTRININSLVSYCEDSLVGWCERVQFKYVYTNKDSVNEIKSITKAIMDELLLDKFEFDVLLMPEGTTNDQLNNIQQECAEVCIKEGWRFCDRLHIRIWGDKRGV